MKDIVLIGAGGVGREAAMLIEDINRNKEEWRLLGYVDDNTSLTGKDFYGYPVLGGINWLDTISKEIHVVCTIADSRIKKHIISRINKCNVQYARLIHPTAVVSRYVEMGQDIIIQANCVITTDIVIGNHVQLNPQCGIGHDSKISDYSSLFWNVNVSGNVSIGEGCILGTKTTIIQGKSIGAWSITGANSNIVHDIPPRCTAVGNPARPIKYNEEV